MTEPGSIICTTTIVGGNHRIIWSLLPCSSVYTLLHHGACVVLAENLVTMKHQQNRIANRTSYDVDMVIGSVCFVEFFIKYIGLPICVHC